MTNLVVSVQLPLWLAVRARAEQAGVSLSCYMRRMLIEATGIEGLSEDSFIRQHGGAGRGAGRKPRYDRVKKAERIAKGDKIVLDGAPLIGPVQRVWEDIDYDS
jgi:hypothetical protein